MQDNPYEILQVSENAEPEVIDAAFRKLALKYHPDTNPQSSANERMQKINWAYDLLRDPKKRADYDLFSRLRNSKTQGAADYAYREREREREREQEREKEKQREKEREQEREKEKQREKEREHEQEKLKQREQELEIEKKTKKELEQELERERQRQKQWEKEKKSVKHKEKQKISQQPFPNENYRSNNFPNNAGDKLPSVKRTIWVASLLLFGCLICFIFFTIGYNFFLTENPFIAYTILVIRIVVSIWFARIAAIGWNPNKPILRTLLLFALTVSPIFAWILSYFVSKSITKTDQIKKKGSSLNIAIGIYAIVGTVLSLIIQSILYLFFA